MSLDRQIAATRRIANEVLATPADDVVAARRGRACMALLAAAALAYVIVALYATRGIAPYLDGMAWLLRASDGLSLGALLEPHNGHLIAVTRLQYWVGLEVVGPAGWVPLLFQMVYVMTSAFLLNALLRRRLDPLLALLPSVLLLFAGSMTVIFNPNVAVFAQSTAFGLGALLALEHRTRRTDILACALLALGLLAFSLGIAFAVGAALMVASRDEARRGWWIPVVPLLAYAVWAVWARSHFTEGSLEFGGAGPESGPASNLLLLPTYALDSLAAALAAAAGLGRELAGISSLDMISINWGRPFAFALIALVVLAGTMRRRPEAIALAVIAILLVDWTLGTLGYSVFRPPNTERYAFPVVALLAVLLAACFPSGARVGLRVGLAAVAALCVALPGNLFALRVNSADIRSTSAAARAQLTATDLAAAHADPERTISDDLFSNVTVRRYEEFAAEHPGLSFTDTELLTESEAAREAADETLGRLLAVATQPVAAGDLERADCVPLVPDSELPAAGAVIEPLRGEATLELRRFASMARVEVPLPAGAAAIRIEPDGSSVPWRIDVEGDESVRVCPLGG